MKKRPNPAVGASERNARIAEDMSDLANKTMPAVSSLPSAIKNAAQRRRSTANKIRREKPFLYEIGS